MIIYITKRYLPFYYICISLFIRFVSSNCDSYLSCIECVLSNCNWNTQNNNCISIVLNESGMLPYLNDCEDIQITSNLCENIDNNSIPFNAQIKTNVNTPLNNNYIFCKWEIYSFQKSKAIILNFNKQNEIQSNTFFNLEIHYNDQTITTKSLNEKDDNYKLEIKNAKKIIFIYYIHSISSSVFDSSPFEIEFTYQSKNKTNITLIITISLGIFVIIVITIAIIIFMIKRNKTKGDTPSEHIHHRKRRFTVRNAKHLIAMKHLHELFLKLNILKYDQSLNEFGNNCTICLEQFKYKVSVVKGICGHIFHEKCLKELLYKDINKDEHKCPNCNGNLVEEESHTGSRKAKRRLTAILILNNKNQIENSARSSSRTSSTRNIICSHTPLDELFNNNNDMINKQPISKETIDNPISHS